MIPIADLCIFRKNQKLYSVITHNRSADRILRRIGFVKPICIRTDCRNIDKAFLYLVSQLHELLIKFPIVLHLHADRLCNIDRRFLFCLRHVFFHCRLLRRELKLLHFLLLCSEPHPGQHKSPDCYRSQRKEKTTDHCRRNPSEPGVSVQRLLLDLFFHKREFSISVSFFLSHINLHLGNTVGLTCAHYTIF